jgi:predicted membrane protein
LKQICDPEKEKMIWQEPKKSWMACAAFLRGMQFNGETRELTQVLFCPIAGSRKERRSIEMS